VCAKQVRGAWYSCVRCGGCGFLYVNPEPDPGELAVLYGAEYSDGHVAVWHGLEDHLNASVLRRLKGLGVTSLLDLGAGQGRFVRMALDVGIEASGVEPSAQNCQVAFDSYGVRLANVTVHDYLATAGDSVDCVTMLNVLEHLPDPVGVLRRLAGLLGQNGKLLLVVPNVAFTLFLGRVRRALWFRDPYMLESARFRQQGFDPPIHLSSFSGTSLRRALEAAGFQVSYMGQAPVIGSSDLVMRLGKVGVRAVGWALQQLTRGRLVFGYSLLAVASRGG
jgi:SAM-dependent methyltransferase